MGLRERLAKLEKRLGVPSADQRAAESEAAAVRVWAKMQKYCDQFNEDDADLAEDDLCKRSVAEHFAWHLRFSEPRSLNDIFAAHGMSRSPAPLDTCALYREDLYL